MLSVDNALVYIKHAFIYLGISVYTPVSKKELGKVNTHYTSPVVWPLLKAFFRYTYMSTFSQFLLNLYLSVSCCPDVFVSH